MNRRKRHRFGVAFLVISAALPRVISRLRRGYVRPSDGLCFAAVGGKVNECPLCGHIFISGAHTEVTLSNSSL